MQKGEHTRDSGATGSLQAAYNNDSAGPVVIQLDGTRKSIIVRDTSRGGSGSRFIGVQNNVASVYYGLTVDGCSAEHTPRRCIPTRASIRIRSGNFRKAWPMSLRAVSPWQIASDIFLSMTEDTDIYGIFTGGRTSSSSPRVNLDHQIGAFRAHRRRGSSLHR